MLSWQCNVSGALSRRDLNVEDDIPFAVLARQDRELLLAGHLTMPARLDLTWRADDADPTGLTEHHAIAGVEVGGVIAARGMEAGLLAPLKSGEERLEALIQP